MPCFTGIIAYLLDFYYNYSTGGISYNHDMIKDEMLIPNGVSKNASINYELTGYINDVNTQYTQVLMEYGANQSITNVYEYGAQRNSATINGTKAYYMYDGRGSVSSMTGNSGKNVVSYNYDAYGVVTKCSSTLNNPHQYNAEYTDSSTEYQYLRARYYDPEHGRFLTKDTYLGEPNDPLSRNLYTYVRNNPINLVDPSGHLFGLILGIVTVGMALYGTYKAVDNHNQQTAAIRDQQASYERNARVQENVQTRPNNLKAPTSPNQKGNFSYYNARDKKVVTFTSAAAYFEYKKLCDELDKLDKDLALSVVHNTLDAVGVIPGFGEIADAANGCIYLAEGDYVNAGLSFVSCIPVAGDTAGKGGKAVNTALDYSDETLDFVNNVTKYGDDVADFAGDAAKYGDDALDAIGDATKSSKPMTWNEFQHANKGKYTKSEMSDAWSQYKKANGLDATKTPTPSSKPDQIHHFATDKNGKYTDQFMEITNKYGLDLDQSWNKESLPHQGRHPDVYHEFVLNEMQKIDAIAQGDKDIFLNLYEDRVKNVVRNNPDMLYLDGWK